MQVLRCRAFANAPSRVIMGTVTGAEPTPEIPRPIPQRDTAQMGTDTDHHQISLVTRNGSVLIACQRIVGQIWVARLSCQAGQRPPVPEPEPFLPPFDDG